MDLVMSDQLLAGESSSIEFLTLRPPSATGGDDRSDNAENPRSGYLRKEQGHGSSQTYTFFKKGKKGNPRNRKRVRSSREE